jgi:hypothetical protein
MRNRPIALSLVLASLVAFASLPIAAADGPVVDGPHRLEGQAALTNCGTFTILDQYVLDFTLRLFFDRSGTLVRLEEHVSGTDTLINSVTGKRYTSRFANNVLIDPATGLGANAGIIFRLTVPGAGAVFLDVGRIVTNQAGTVVTFQAGPHQFFSGDLAGLCAALA